LVVIKKMSNGLDIGIEEFMKMKSLDRDITMYRNMQEIRKGFKDYRFHRKIQYVWLSVLSTITLILIGIKRGIGL